MKEGALTDYMERTYIRMKREGHPDRVISSHLGISERSLNRYKTRGLIPPVRRIE